MKRGFTLLELTVAISLSSIIFMVVGGLLAFAIDRNSKNQRQELFEQVKNDLAADLTNSVRWSKNVEADSGHINVDGTVYMLRDGKIFKNGQSLVPEGVVVAEWEVVDRTRKPGLVSLEIRIKMHNKAFSVAEDTLRLVVSQRRTEVTL
jgi:prepilin-type N-terminal cleavage/methylation domain-containing protein